MNMRVVVLVLLLCARASLSPAIAADNAGSQPKSSAATADATQSFNSPLGLGSGATLSVTNKGTSFSGSLDVQSPRSFLNFWQVGLSGTTDTNGQAKVYSSNDSDAPGFKGKLGVGRSSFQSVYTGGYSSAAAILIQQVWCIDVAAQIAGLPQSLSVTAHDKDCQAMLDRARHLLQTAPLAPGEKPEERKRSQDLVEALAAGFTRSATIAQMQQAQNSLCSVFKTGKPDLFKLCPASGATIPTAEELHHTHSAAYDAIVGPAVAAFPNVYYKWSLNWSPTLQSVDYRSVTNGATDLATKQHWTGFLSTAALDGSVYYKEWSMGLEAAYGKTANITLQNVCNTTTGGTYTAQQCTNAMIGKPMPKGTYSATVAVLYTPGPSALTTALYRPGAELSTHFEKPSGTTGSKTQLMVPLFLSPIASPLSVVFGLQPTWTWNSEPNQRNDFTVNLFVGARPEVP